MAEFLVTNVVTNVSVVLLLEQDLEVPVSLQPSISLSDFKNLKY